MERFFEKISIKQYEKDCIETSIAMGYDKSLWGNDENLLKAEYDDIKLPNRATKTSAGYDFYLPYDIMIAPNKSVTIPTGIKVKMESDEVLQLYPRSSLGFKYGLRLMNTVGIIDSDYYNNLKNEGHILIKIYNSSDEIIRLNRGDKFAQGIFYKFLHTTNEEEITTTRDGGFGSTGK